MSSRLLSSANGFLIVSVIVSGMGIGFARAQDNAPSVETFVDEAVPVETPLMQRYEGAPLPAGTLTMEDVLKAHPPKQPARPPSAAASSLMMSRGLKAVLQKLEPSVTAQAPSKTAAPAKNMLAPKVTASPLKTPSLTEKTSTPEKVPGFAYTPGRAPQNLGPSPAIVSETPAPAPAQEASCSKDIKKWEKTCEEAGYPSTFVGKISGETRTGCEDGALHDVWVTNTCLPPESAKEGVPKKEQAPKADASKIETAPAEPTFTEGLSSEVAPIVSTISEAPKAEAVKTKKAPIVGMCGLADAKETAKAPVSDLCESGKATKVKGKGPWTWSCLGANKGHSEKCSAPAVVKIAAKKEAATPISKEEPVPFAPESAPAPVAPATPVAPPTPTPTPEQAPTAATAPAPEAPPSPPQVGDDPCGEASETMAYESPKRDLCRKGTPSAVKGNGPWTWSCNNNGVDSPCETLAPAGEKAPIPSKGKPLQKAPKVNAAPLLTPSCGAAAGQPASTAPSEGLCNEGKASKVRGADPWSWTCISGKKKVSCATIKPAEEPAKPAATKPVEEPAKPAATKPVEEPAKPAATKPVEEPAKPAATKPVEEPAKPAAPKPAETMPVPPPSPSILSIPPAPQPKPFARPTPSPIPEAAKVTGDVAPLAPPNLPVSSSPVQPPAVRETLQPAPALQETAATASAAPHVAGPPLVLDATMSTILFTRGSGNIEPTVIVTLDKLAAALQKSPGARISLIAYADSSGTPPREAHRLSLTRALAVRGYLASKGVSESRVDIHAEGASASSGYADRVDVKVNE